MDSKILGLVARVSVPCIQLFGIYVIANGHLSPGGAFAGGTILGAAFILQLLVGRGTDDRRTEDVSTLVESLAVGWYLLLGLAGLLAGRAFLANRGVFPLGTPGAPFSSGMIVLVALGVGAKVTSTVYTLFRGLSMPEGE
jgi:multicomponent Na+:H+ antiporter subunit B